MLYNCVNMEPLWKHNSLVIMFISETLIFRNKAEQNMSNTVFEEDCVHHLYLNNTKSENDSYI